MLKRNKLSIFLLAVVAMLTIYYIRMPKNEAPVVVESEPRYQEFVSKRETIMANRKATLETLSLSISASEDANSLIEEYNTLNSLTAREIELENTLRTIGFIDALVCVDLKEGIDVSIYASDFSKSQYVMVRTMVNEEFGDYSVNVYHVIKEAV